MNGYFTKLPCCFRNGMHFRCEVNLADWYVVGVKLTLQTKTSIQGIIMFMVVNTEEPLLRIYQLFLKKELLRHQRSPRRYIGSSVTNLIYQRLNGFNFFAPSITNKGTINLNIETLKDLKGLTRT